jgi:hypothetical protein
MLFIFFFSPCVVLFMFIWHLFLLHDFSYAAIDMIGRGEINAKMMDIELQN